MRRLDAWVESFWYWPHVEPIWKALPSEARGTCWVGPALLNKADSEWGIKAAGSVPRFSEITLVGGYLDLARLAGRPAILATHGAGQSYAGVPEDTVACNHPSYPGGVDHENVELFLCPSEYAAARWAKRYPEVKTAVIGSPKLDGMFDLRRSATAPAVVALNWGSSVSPESTSALPDLIPHLPALREACGGSLVGTGHPRARPVFERFYGRAGIPYIPELGVLPSLAICDNSSVGWEWAALGVPVVWVNAALYRAVPHGLRFGGTGQMPIAEPEELASYISDILRRPLDQLGLDSWQAGQAAYDGLTDGNAANRAVVAILEQL